jgi:hypothetical protein
VPQPVLAGEPRVFFAIFRLRCKPMALFFRAPSSRRPNITPAIAEIPKGFDGEKSHRSWAELGNRFYSKSRMSISYASSRREQCKSSRLAP